VQSGATDSIAHSHCADSHRPRAVATPPTVKPTLAPPPTKPAPRPSPARPTLPPKPTITLPLLPAGAAQTYSVTNPTTNAKLYVQVFAPQDTSQKYPALVLVPGGIGDSRAFKDDAMRMASAGIVAITFDPDGRGQSTGQEDYNGYRQQDGLAAVVRFAATLPYVDAQNIGIVTYSYGITMGSGALARHPDLPVKFLIDWEGPADRNDTSGCSTGNAGRILWQPCSNDAWWSEREAVNFIGRIRVPYQRIQSEKDHVQPDNTHAVEMINAAIQGGVPWVRLNDYPPNQTYDPNAPPAMLPEAMDRQLTQTVIRYARELFGTSAEAPVATPSSGQGVLYLGIMVHLEGWNDGQDQARFQEHARLMREYATLFEKYGAKLTWESKEVTEGILRWGDNVLLEMEQRGHGVGVHADIGGQRDYDCRRFAADLRAEKEQLESLGVTVRHVSGIVSHCDWVTAAADAGYLFTTGQVAYAVMSMPPESRPAEYRNCPSPAVCYDVFPAELQARLHPWRMNSGLDWLTPSPNGRLVLIPASGELSYMEENATGQTSDKGKDLTQADIDYFIQELEQAIALAQPGQWNYMSRPDAAAYNPTKMLQNLLADWERRTGSSPYSRAPFITSLIHENDFYRSGAVGWTSIYFAMNGPKKGNPLPPPWDLNAPDPSRPRTEADKDAIWAAYEELVAYAAAHLTVVTSEDIVALARKERGNP